MSGEGCHLHRLGRSAALQGPVVASGLMLGSCPGTGLPTAFCASLSLPGDVEQFFVWIFCP